MSAFLIFHSTVKDPAAFKTYAEGVGPTLEPFGGAVAMKGKLTEVLAGQHDHLTVGILSFPDRDAANGWYQSKAYQALVPVRDAAADMTVVCYEVPQA